MCPSSRHLDQARLDAALQQGGEELRQRVDAEVTARQAQADATTMAAVQQLADARSQQAALSTSLGEAQRDLGAVKVLR